MSTLFNQARAGWRGNTAPRKDDFVMRGKRLSWLRLLLGLLMSSSIGIVAYRRHSLNRSGVVGAMVTGTTTFGLGGWSWGASLVYFFVSSSLLSHFREREKERTVAAMFSKGGERDIGQVAANAGVATLLSLAASLTTTSRTQELLQAGYTGALATANGDTWATELGVLNKQQPRLITTGKPVPPGTSGGISPLGTGAAAAGGLSLGLFFWLLQGLRKAAASLPLIGLLSGLAGCLADSFMGATVQAMYRCPACGKETERRVHHHGSDTIHTVPLRGIPWVDNDVVNFCATLVGALVAMGLHLTIQQISDKKDSE